MTRTLGALLDERAAVLIGRERERAALRSLLAPEGPVLAFVHGVGGVGKTALLRAFAADARARGVPVVALDGRSIEPTEAGFRAELARVVGDEPEALGALGDLVALTIDTYELLALLDDWLRREFLPRLPGHVRVVLAGRTPPGAAWVAALGELLAPVPLGNLAAGDAHVVLRRAGLTDPESRRANRLARGHPLSLQLAAAAGRAHPGRPVGDVAVPPVVQEVARLFLNELAPPVRRALDAAAVVRRTTLQLLQAMLPDEPAAEAFERLRTLPFVELGRDGLVLHDTVREVLVAHLRAADPARYRALRAAAWRQLRREDRQSTDPWRTTADTLFLLENELLREAFFPAMPGLPSVEPGRPGDREAVIEICRLHEPPAGVQVLAAWFDAIPERFRVAGEADGTPAGYLLMCEPSAIPKPLRDADPLVRLWQAHLRANPVPPGQHVVFGRHYQCRDAGEGFAPAQAAIWIDTIRDLMARRPHVRRNYSCVLDRRELPPREALGLRELPGGPPIVFDDVEYTPIMVDFGPASVDGWLSDLVGAELGAEEILDVGARQLVLDGRRVDLTKLEFAVLDYLRGREGRVVRREDLLRDVWGYDWTGGSNVVEVVVSALRKKLGDRSGRLETVRGVGYRLAPPA